MNDAEEVTTEETTMTRAKLDAIITSHAAWLQDPTSGKQANFSQQDLSDRDFSGRDLRHSSFCAANVSHSSFRAADVSHSDFRSSNVSHSNFRAADAIGADFRAANVSEANFSGANVSRADFRDANVSGSDFCGANASDANFCGANVSGADFYGANVSGADFQGVDLQQAHGILGVGPYDGYMMYAVRHADGVRIAVGCRWFTLSEARNHWQPDGRQMATHANRVEHVAKMLAGVDALIALATAAGWTV